MIEVLPASQGNVLGMKASGTLTVQDYTDVLIPRLEGIMQDGKARFLLEMGEEFQGWTWEAMWADTKFGFSHRNDFEKVAIVGASAWIEWGAKLGALIMSGEVRTYAATELNDAWNWLGA